MGFHSHNVNKDLKKSVEDIAEHDRTDHNLRILARAILALSERVNKVVGRIEDYRPTVL